ncbi:isopenicillin N synthase family oxygenase [Candidatus Nomurabacteria bacterium]|nr:isopenicillin N synthase family oxygenase [Candidatus Nomurabacteria bacterium]
MVQRNFGNAAGELLAHHITTIAMPGRKDVLVDQIMRLLPRIFKRVPQDASWGFDTHTRGDPDLGFVWKRGTARSGDTREDIKLYLHWNPALPGLFRGRSITGRDLELLMQLCEELFYLTLTQAIRLAQDIDSLIPGIKLTTKIRSPEGTQANGANDHVLRILIYQQVHPDLAGQIGQEHDDRDGLTLALHESSPGLEYLSPSDGQWRPASSDPGQALVFPGLKMGELTDGDLPALRHRVMDSTASLNPRIKRVSIVMFIHPYNGYCRLRTH